MIPKNKSNILLCNVKKFIFIYLLKYKLKYKLLEILI